MHFNIEFCPKGEQPRGRRSAQCREAVMHAQQGDWLVIEGRDINHHARRGLILSVESVDGTPPYRVRWEDNGHEALCFPGPDTHIVQGPATRQ
jgi:hypothetical protein